MITVFKKKSLPKGMELVALNDIYFSKNTVTLLDDRAKAIIAGIDHSKMLSPYAISSRFDGTTLNIDKLSTGCKTALNILYNPDKVFCLKECGNNALEILFGLNAGNVYSDYALIPFEMDTVNVQTSSGKKMICDYEELKEWWSYEE